LVRLARGRGHANHSSNKSANQRFTAWLNQGLKRQNWSARRVAQMGLLIALGVVVAACI
jgi:hypothetical protein